MSSYSFKAAPNNPPHLFLANSTYMLTASIYDGAHLIDSAQRKTEWRDAFYEAARIYNWKITAWVVLDNHYHAMAESPENADTLSKFTGGYHKFTARKWNDVDGIKGRKVWWNYWDTCIRSEADYYNRLRYIFWNPVKHGLVEKPEDYPFSNYLDFMEKWQLNFTDTREVDNVPEF